MFYFSSTVTYQLKKESGIDVLSIPPVRLGDKEQVSYETATIAVTKALHLNRAIQACDGHWPAENAGPMFFTPPLVRYVLQMLLVNSSVCIVSSYLFPHFTHSSYFPNNRVNDTLHSKGYLGHKQVMLFRPILKFRGIWNFEYSLGVQSVLLLKQYNEQMYLRHMQLIALYISGAINTVLTSEHKKEMARYIYNHQVIILVLTTVDHRIFYI